MSAKFKKGDFCYIHASSSIVTLYFETFGQPLDEENLNTACFEGICTKVVKKGKPPKGSDRNLWCVTINALHHMDNDFVINENDFDEYFSTDVVEPDGWLLWTKAAMIDMEKQFSGYEDSESDKGFLDNEEGLTVDTTQIPTNFIIGDFVSTPKLAREISALPAILVSDELAWEELNVRFEKYEQSFD